jgi:hypothetical protein
MYLLLKLEFEIKERRDAKRSEEDLDDAINTFLEDYENGLYDYDANTDSQNQKNDSVEEEEFNPNVDPNDYGKLNEEELIQDLEKWSFPSDEFYKRQRIQRDFLKNSYIFYVCLTGLFSTLYLLINK